MILSRKKSVQDSAIFDPDYLEPSGLALKLCIKNGFR